MFQLKDLEVIRDSLRCACHRSQLLIKKALLHSDCALLLKALKKSQEIVLQFKNGWASRKRDVLRKYQDQSVDEVREDISKLNSSIAEHIMRDRKEALVRKKQLLKAAEELISLQVEEYGAEAVQKAAVMAEVSELSLPGTEAKKDSDSDEEEEGDDSERKEEKGDEEKGMEEEEEDVSSDTADLFEARTELKATVRHICKKRALIAVAATRWLTWVAVAERTMMWRGPLMKALDDIAADISFRKGKRSSRGRVKEPVDISAAIASLRITDEDAIILDQFRQLGAYISKLLTSLEGGDIHPTIGALLYVRSELLSYFKKGASSSDMLHPVIVAFCAKAQLNCAIKFELPGDRPALIGAALDPRHHTLTFLSKSEQGLCFEVLSTAYTNLKLELDDCSPVNEPISSTLSTPPSPSPSSEATPSP